MPNLNSFQRVSVGVTTTDDTVTTAATFDTAPFPEAAFSIWVKVLARQTNNANETGQYCRVAAFERHGGTLTQIGSTRTVSTDNESVGGWEVAMDANGDDIRVRVTGAAGDTVRWLVEADIQINDTAPLIAD